MQHTADKSKRHMRDLYAEKEVSSASSGLSRENVAFANSVVNDTGHFYERGGVRRVKPYVQKRLIDPRVSPIAIFGSCSSDVQIFMN